MKFKSLCAVLGLFAASASMAAGAAKAPASAAAKAAPAAVTAAAPAKKAVNTTAATAAAAAPGQVWVNTDSKIYHCQGSQHFGKTKHGEYMQQVAAKAKGFKPAAGKECQ